MSRVLRVLDALRAPLLIGYALTDRRTIIQADVRRWQDVQMRSGGLLRLLGQAEFRTLYYHRLRHGNVAGRAFQIIARAIYRGQVALHLITADIGPGLFIQHGFATIVAARRIGADCWINQQVTIGHTTRDDVPTLEDGVTVGAGALVLGDVTLGARCCVGAGAVVLSDVPADATAVGAQARALIRPEA